MMLFEETLQDRRMSLMRKQLTRAGKAKYSQYRGNLINYMGGKCAAVGYLTELLPNNITRIISPFFGGGAFELACVKELGLEVKGFDIFNLIVNLWQCIIEHPKELVAVAKKHKHSEAHFKKIKDILKQYALNNEPIKDNIEIAAMTLYHISFCFKGMFFDSITHVPECVSYYKNRLVKILNNDLKNISVEQKSFEKVFAKYPNDFFYCDPPYWLAEGGLSFGSYYTHHKNFNHKLLRDCLKSHKGGFILCYNDCETIKEYYEEFLFVKPQYSYCCNTSNKNRIPLQNKELWIYKPHPEIKN